MLPAVEALQVLATAVRAHDPSCAVQLCGKAEFLRFLEVPETASEVEAVVTITDHDHDHDHGPTGCTASLETRAVAGKAKITRRKEHVRATFGVQPAPELLDFQSAAAPMHSAFMLDAGRLYEALVPFGPAYQTGRGPIALSPIGATGWLEMPRGHATQPPLGSAFALDGTFHVICAWAQRYLGAVTFPVSYDQRRIFEPVPPGTTCFCRAQPRQWRHLPLIVDAWIFSAQGKLHEAIAGIHMDDVSRGRMTVPDWIRP